MINELIGLPWVVGAEGPDAYDCWGLARTVQREMFQREMPRISEPPVDVRSLVKFVREHRARTQWREVPGPVHGGLVEMAHGRHPFHIGVYLDIDGGGILHSVNPAGVCWDLEITLRASGWRRFTYHDWTG